MSVGSRTLRAAGGGGLVPGSSSRYAKKLRLQLEEEEQFALDLKKSHYEQIQAAKAESAKARDTIATKIATGVVDVGIADIVDIDKNTKDTLDQLHKRYEEDLEDAKNRRLDIKFAIIDAEADAEAELKKDNKYVPLLCSLCLHYFVLRASCCVSTIAIPLSTIEREFSHPLAIFLAQA